MMFIIILYFAAADHKNLRTGKRYSMSAEFAFCIFPKAYEFFINLGIISFNSYNIVHGFSGNRFAFTCEPISYLMAVRFQPCVS